MSIQFEVSLRCESEERDGDPRQLYFYAVPRGALVKVVRVVSEGNLTREQAQKAMVKDIADYAAQDEALESEDAA